jgi:hypothetical protein
MFFSTGAYDDSPRPLSADHQTLLDRILTYSFDDGDVAFPFADRLARENCWSRSYAKRVIAEYRRFMFLAVVAGHPVTPSDQVDQAWHLHLLYTRSYWDQFGPEVLGRRTDHCPTNGGPAEKSKFEQWYDRTLDSYRYFFGAPPRDIWPVAAVRFGIDLHYARVNTKRNCVIPRVQVHALYAAAVVALLLMLADAGPTFDRLSAWLPTGTTAAQ